MMSSELVLTQLEVTQQQLVRPPAHTKRKFGKKKLPVTKEQFIPRDCQFPKALSFMAKWNDWQLSSMQVLFTLISLYWST